jgi:HEAT repeat protein
VADEVLRGFLEDQDPTVATVAVLRLSERNETATFPYLLRLVKGGNPSLLARAVAGLENVTSLRVDAVGSAEIAEAYERWYATARAGNDRAWFRAALRRKGYDVGTLAPYVEGEGDPAAVPLLARALRDDDPILRRNAALALERITGRSFGAVDRGTSQPDAARIADQWTRWWESVNAGR